MTRTVQTFDNDQLFMGGKQEDSNTLSVTAPTAAVVKTTTTGNSAASLQLKATVTDASGVSTSETTTSTIASGTTVTAAASTITQELSIVEAYIDGGGLLAIASVDKGAGVQVAIDATLDGGFTFDTPVDGSGMDGVAPKGLLLARNTGKLVPYSEGGSDNQPVRVLDHDVDISGGAGDYAVKAAFAGVCDRSRLIELGNGSGLTDAQIDKIISNTNLEPIEVEAQP